MSLENKRGPGANPDPETTDLADQANTEVEPALFDADRYSPVTVAVWQRLPNSNARAFGIASALGRILSRSGSSERLRSGREAAGSLVTAKRRPIILAAIGIKPRQWTKFVADWENRYLAHRCGTATAFLFARPLYASCPACKAEIAVDHIPPKPKNPRGPGFADGHISADGTATLVPVVGTNSADGSVQTVPVPNAKVTHHETGLLRGEVGVVGPEASKELEEEALRNRATAAEIAAFERAKAALSS